jgi:ElaB/YqjD/DUF883 family membrane-anchored ribosome-binding protein
MESTIRPRQETSLFGLIAGLREDLRHLFREEAQLVKKELAEKISYFGRNAIYLAIGGAAGYLALVCLLLALGFIIASGFEAMGLSTGVALFLGFLIIALLVGAVGGILVGKALSGFSKESLVPEKTVETLREIKEGGIEQVQVPIKKVQATPDPKDKRTSDQIKDDVERTRSRIGREVRGIRNHLSMAHLAADVVCVVKNNPLRTVGIGLGTGLAGFVLMRIARLFGRKHAV